MYDCNDKSCRSENNASSDREYKRCLECAECTELHYPENGQLDQPNKYHHLNNHRNNHDYHPEIYRPDVDQDGLNDYLFSYDPNFNMSASTKSFSLSSHESTKKKKSKKFDAKEFSTKNTTDIDVKNYKNLKEIKDDDKLANRPCYTCEKSKFQTIQTYESIKYVLMTVILVSIIDGLFTLNYQKLLIQHLQIILLKHKNPLMFCEYNKLLLFNDDKLRIATGMLYLINVSIQFIGFVGISNDSLILTCSYAIYSTICFIFTIGTYLNYRRLFISLCINCLLAILSIIFSVMIKIVKPIKRRNMFVV